MKNCSHLVIVIVAMLILIDARLPSSIKTCSRNDPNLAKCIIETIKDFQPRLGDGVLDPDFRVRPLDGLKLDNIKFDRGPNFRVLLTKMVVSKGANNFRIEKMRVNLQDLIFDSIIHFPRVEFKGKYDMNVNILLVDLAGKGDLNGVFEDYKARVKLRGKPYQHNGKTYIHFDKIQIKIVIGKTQVDLKNLFNGNPTLESVGNALVNENSNSFVSEIIPSLEQNLSDIFTESANKIVATASFDELFPNV